MLFCCFGVSLVDFPSFGSCARSSRSYVEPVVCLYSCVPRFEQLNKDKIVTLDGSRYRFFQGRSPRVMPTAPSANSLLG